jgi:hypothetical protein
MHRREFLLSTSAAALAAEAPLKVRQVDIYHHSHTDVGFTDLPSVCRDMQVRFLDAALDACLARKTTGGGRPARAGARNY